MERPRRIDQLSAVAFRSQGLSVQADRPGFTTLGNHSERGRQGFQRLPTESAGQPVVARGPFTPATPAESRTQQAASSARSTSPEAGPNRKTGQAPLPTTDGTAATGQTDQRADVPGIITASSGTVGESDLPGREGQGTQGKRTTRAAAAPDAEVSTAGGGSHGSGRVGGRPVTREDNQPDRGGSNDRKDTSGQREEEPVIDTSQRDEIRDGAQRFMRHYFAVNPHVRTYSGFDGPVHIDHTRDHDYTDEQILNAPWIPYSADPQTRAIQGHLVGRRNGVEINDDAVVPNTGMTAKQLDIFLGLPRIEDVLAGDSGLTPRGEQSK